MFKNVLQKSAAKKIIVAITSIAVSAAGITAFWLSSVNAVESPAQANVSAAATIAPTAVGVTPQEQKIVNDFKNNFGIEVEKISKAAMPGMYEAVTDRGILYVSADAKYFFRGELYDFTGVNYHEITMAQLRIEGVKKFEKNTIEYKAKDEKYVINVFTDITCGYCRLMHQQIAAYNELGITVRYLAFPRSGVTDQYGNLSQGFQDLRSIWCHEKPAEALTKAKNGGTVAQRICDAPIAEEMEFGRSVGISGTPGIILENGMLLPGYRPPEDLIKILQAI